MSAETVHERPARPSPVRFLLRHGWKLGLAVLAFGLLTAPGAIEHPARQLHLPQQPLAGTGATGPTVISCGSLPAGITRWTSAGSPYYLPLNTNNDPFASEPGHPPACPSFPLGDEPPPASPPGVVVPSGSTLIIDATDGPVRIFSQGAGININGGVLETTGTSATNYVSMDADTNVASWDGVAIHASGGHPGNASLSFITIQHALTAIRIDSGATQTLDPDPNHPGSFVPYGLALANSGIGPSYFDGIDANETPISVTGQADGAYGTLNNIGSQGINVKFSSTPAIGDKALRISGMTFGSSVPFDHTACPPAPASCVALGAIGNNAVIGSFVAGQAQPVLIDNNAFFRAGSFGVDLENANHPQITNNTFVCNGSGSPTPVTSCTPTTKVPRFSAIYLNNVSADLVPDPTGGSQATTGISNNFGQQNGLDALVLSGKVTSDLSWKTPTNDSRSPDQAPAHSLGYMVANVLGTGNLEVVGKTLTVGAGAVVKVAGGSITLTGGKLDASAAGIKTFTSMRDNNVGIQACPSVFLQACPANLPSNEWLGIQLSGASAVINMSNILFPRQGVGTSGAAPAVPAPDGNSYGLVLTGSRIGPSFLDGVAINGVSAYVDATYFCRVDPAAVLNGSLSSSQCVDAGPGNHGLSADYTGNPAAGYGLRISNDFFLGSSSEAILGTSLAGRHIDVESNTIQAAGTFGIQLAGSDRLTLKQNAVNDSGIGKPTDPTTYSAIYLNGVKNADFDSEITGNMGGGNGLNAIVFHGSTATDLTWQTVGRSTALGYIVDGNLTVNGALTLTDPTGDYAAVLAGAIAVKTGPLTANGATFTSLKQQTPSIPSCGSVFVPKVSGACPAPDRGDWAGLILDGNLTGNPLGQQENSLTYSEIRYATTGIFIDKPAPSKLKLDHTNIRETGVDGIHSESPLEIMGGAITNSKRSTGNGIWFDQPSTIKNVTLISNTGQEGILGTDLPSAPTTVPLPAAGPEVNVSSVSIDNAGTYGIRLTTSSGSLDGRALTVLANTITNSGKGTSTAYPAILVNGVAGGNIEKPSDASKTTQIADNKGSGNALDALVFHGTAADAINWQSARRNRAGDLLGYLLDGGLDMAGNQLTVGAGDIVKVGNGGMIKLSGGQLQADSTSFSSQKIFTSLRDKTAGLVACPSVLFDASIDCDHPAAGDWAGINLSGGTANGAFVNAAIRYAATGLFIDSGALATSGSSVYGLVVSRSTIGPSQFDAIDSNNTALSVTNSTIATAAHGIAVDLGSSSGQNRSVHLSGNRFSSTVAEAILGQGLQNQAVWITDNSIKGAATFGIRLHNADAFVLRNNNISGSGAGGGSNKYPAIQLKAVSADLVRNVRGNVGSSNGLDAIALDGTITSNLKWVTPTNDIRTHSLGYLFDDGVTFDGTQLTVAAGDVVKALGGPITLRGGSLVSTGSGTSPAVFTSAKDGLDVAANGASCPSIFAADCAHPAAGDWGGIFMTTKAGQIGVSSITDTEIRYPTTGIGIDSGPVSSSLPNLTVTRAKILHASRDGINAHDTPLQVSSSIVGDELAATKPDIGRYGIFASFLSRANCPAGGGCVRLTVFDNYIYFTGQDGIVANGLGGQPTVIDSNHVTGASTYGIRLAGADNLTLIDNTVNDSGGAGTSFRYQAIDLNGVKADFELASATGTVAGNHGTGNGLDAMVIDGLATKPLTWLTTGVAVGAAPADHFGYLLDGALTINGSLTTNTGDVVKVLGGAIKINGGLTSTGTTFTSLKDGNYPLKVCDLGFDSALLAKDIHGCPAAATGDWGGINIDADNSSFSDGRLLYASSGIEISNAKLNISGATLAHIDGTALASMGSERLTVTCSNIRDNKTGIAADYATVTESDVYGNSVADLAGNANLLADYDWLGTSPVTGSATVTNPRPAQRPSAHLTFTSDNQLANDDHLGNSAFGIGHVSVTADFNRQMSLLPIPAAGFSLKSGTGSTHNFTAPTPPDYGWSPTRKSWTTNPYNLNLTQADAGLNTATVSTARGCVPAEDSNPDSNLMTPVSSDFSASINPTLLTVDPATGDYGGTVPLGALLTTNGQGLGDEQVDFGLNGNGAGYGMTQPSGGLNAGRATHIANLGTIHAGPYPTGVTAAFAGDPDLFYTPAPAAGAAAISAALTVNKAGTTTAVESGLEPSTYGESVTWTATVTSTVPSGLDPKGEGSVTFEDGTTVLCSAGLAATGNTASCTKNNLGAASHTITATYNPATNPNFTGSSNTLTQTVNKANTSTAVQSSAATSTYGDSVTWTATVTSTLSGGLNPKGEGNVTFEDGSTTLCSNVTLTLTGNTAGCTKSNLSAGPHTIKATYNPASTNPNFTGSSDTLTQTVNMNNPTLTTNPSAGGGLGTEITESITVSDGATPVGTVTFHLYGPGDSSCAGTDLASGTGFSNVILTAGMATSAQFQPTTAGDYYWIVDYSGDSNHNSKSTVCGDKVTITNDLVTKTELTSAPTDVSTSLTSVSLTANVTPALASAALPTAGTVDFKAGGSAISCDTGSTTGLALTNASSSVLCITDYATVNGKQVTAEYSGDSGSTTYDSSTGSLLGSTTAISSSDPTGVLEGDPITFTATLIPSAAGGTVAFFDDGAAISVCTARAVSSGTATCSTTLSGTGTHSIVAIYSGSATYMTSEDSLSQAVN